MDLENLLRDTLKKHLQKTDGMTPPHLGESIAYSLLAPGKRIRPRLLFACGEMVGIPSARLGPAAAAIEMIHCFTLIHDDLPCMDNDDFRRGMPSNHKKFGESTALLAGDALMALAVEVFLDSHIEPTHLVKGLSRLLWAMGPRGVIGGQAAESLLGKQSKLEDLQQMHRQKTGALFSASILIPKDFAGFSDSSEKGRSLITFADELGLAFQTADDLEDAADGSSKNEAQQPTSILFYQSRAEASNSTVKRLQYAIEDLSQKWGPSSEGLQKIASEVLVKIQSQLAL
jgi:geranylgeranyl pyrophosphate synthase